MSRQLCVFGEVLFDTFPDGQAVLGGAPFNVAWHLQALGQQPRFISRIGNDPEGASISAAMSSWGMTTQAVQVDDKLPTGKVQVTLQQGEPSYDIVSPSAWDAIELATEQVQACELLYHGSLALRHEASAQALQQLVAAGPGCIFVDVNLRSPWWHKETVLALIRQAHWTKINHEEFDLLYPGDAATLERLTAFLADYGLEGVILTHGKRGAEVLNAAGEHVSITPEGDAQVVDTVGAGDAFTAVMIKGILEQWPLQLTLQRAQQLASAIVGQRGATVDDPVFYQDILARWGSATI